MAGLLSGILPYVYSQSDRLKRNVNGLLSDPRGSLEQTAGGLLDAHRGQQNLLAQAFADPGQPFKMTDPNAMQAAAMNMLAGPLGVAPAGIFAGVGAKTANVANLAEAQKRLSAGDDPARVWSETGWGKGPDGKWRFEIDDSNSRPLGRTWGEGEDLKRGNSTTTRRQRALAHPNLSAAYPDSKDIGVSLRPGTSKDAAYFDGAFGPWINAKANPDYGYKPDRSTLLHELQHYVQDKEGFAAGGAPGDKLTKEAAQKFFNNAREQFSGDPAQLLKMAQHRAYLNLAGEAEARLVQSRANMTAAQRAAQFPWEPEYFRSATDSPLASLIVGR